VKRTDEYDKCEIKKDGKRFSLQKDDDCYSRAVLIGGGSDPKQVHAITGRSAWSRATGQGSWLCQSHAEGVRGAGLGWGTAAWPQPKRNRTHKEEESREGGSPGVAVRHGG